MLWVDAYGRAWFGTSANAVTRARAGRAVAAAAERCASTSALLALTRRATSAPAASARPPPVTRTVKFRAPASPGAQSSGASGAANAKGTPGSGAARLGPGSSTDSSTPTLTGRVLAPESATWNVIS